MKRIACLAWLALVGCSVEMDAAGNERFAGRWFIDETEAHALYSASTYELSPDGDVTLVWDAGFYEIPQGHVRDADGEDLCTFGPT